MHPHMTRVVIVSFALAMFATVSACEQKPTNVPEAPVEDVDFAPAEDYDLASDGGGEEEDAPGLNGG